MSNIKQRILANLPPVANPPVFVATTTLMRGLGNFHPIRVALARSALVKEGKLFRWTAMSPGFDRRHAYWTKIRNT